MTMAGNAESIPAINIASPSLRVNLNPKNLVDADHQANTGVENPTINAGKIINIANIKIKMLSLNNSDANNEAVDNITPEKNSIHR
jgi:hypothetical protein